MATKGALAVVKTIAAPIVTAVPPLANAIGDTVVAAKRKVEHKVRNFATSFQCEGNTRNLRKMQTDDLIFELYCRHFDTGHQLSPDNLVRLSDLLRLNNYYVDTMEHQEKVGNDRIRAAAAGVAAGVAVNATIDAVSAEFSTLDKQLETGGVGIGAALASYGTKKGIDAMNGNMQKKIQVVDDELLKQLTALEGKKADLLSLYSDLNKDLKKNHTSMKDRKLPTTIKQNDERIAEVQADINTRQPGDNINNLGAFIDFFNKNREVIDLYKVVHNLKKKRSYYTSMSVVQRVEKYLSSEQTPEFNELPVLDDHDGENVQKQVQKFKKGQNREAPPASAPAGENGLFRGAVTRGLSRGFKAANRGLEELGHRTEGLVNAAITRPGGAKTKKRASRK